MDICIGRNLELILECIRGGNLHPFYTSGDWKALRTEVLRENHGECQLCRDAGKYRAAEIVHHVNHVRRHPELALSKYYLDKDGQKKKNLWAVCRDCHETKCHPERMRKPKAKFFSPEIW